MSGQLTEGAARALTERIKLRATTIAESVDTLVTLIDEARAGGADAALGYASWTAYVEREFADALPRLDRSQRQDVVRRLSAQGMSTRAIAPVVGVSHEQVRKDSRVNNLTPAPSPAPSTSSLGGAFGTGEPPAAPAPATPVPAPTPTPTPIVGRDGKTYQRPEPRPRDPIAEAKADAARQPWIVAGASIARVDTLIKSMRAAGTGTEVLAHAPVDPVEIPFWIDALETLSELTADWLAALRRARLRSVK